MSRGSHLICWAMALLIALAPLPFGSVDPLPYAVLQLCLIAVAIGWVAMRVAAGQPPLPWRDPVLLGGAALLLYGLAQMAPMPPTMLGTLSPAAAALRAAHAPDPSGWAPLSLYPYGTWRSCLHVACWTLAALMIRHCAVDLKGRLVVAGGLVSGALFQAGYGLYEFISGRQHIFGYQKQFFTDVATGTFISRNNYAGYLEMAIPVTLALAMLTLARSNAGLSGSNVPLKRRLAAATGRQSFKALLILMGAFLMAMALLMSRSRMGIIATLVSLLAGGLAVGLKGRSRRFALASVAVALVAGLFATQIDILPVVNRFELLRGEFGTGYGRLAVWKEAVPMLAAYPLFGTGMGTWEMAFSPWRTDASQVRVDFAHNDYLEFAAEAGALGLLLFVAAVAWVVRRRAGLRHDEIALGAGVGLAALAMHSMTDFHLSIPADALAAAVLAGLFLRHEGPHRPARSRLRVGSAAVACSLVLFSLLLSAVSPAAAEIRSDSAAVMRRGPDPEDATHNSGVASLSPDDDLCGNCRMEPFNAMRYIEAAARARERLLKDVEVIVKAQAAGDLQEPETRQYVARRIDAALALARRGLTLAPASGRGHLEAGLLEFGRFALTGLPPEASEDFERALSDFKSAVELQPWRAATHRRVTRLLSPLWDECGEDQRLFIAKATRRARQLDPSAADIKSAAARMGF